MVAWLPTWLETFRIIGTFLIWIILPCQLYMLWRSIKQFRKWEADETARTERWVKDMDTAQKMREEACHLRVQAEVALAQARRHLPASDAVPDRKGMPDV